MTRMFKQLVESSRKKLSRTRVPAQEEEKKSQVLAQPRRKPDFEPLESRVLFSGVGNGFNKKVVHFMDAWGDSVTVKLTGPGKFDITLDAGAKNRADIQNITINSHATSASVLDIFTKPHPFDLSASYTGGMKTYGDAVYHAMYAVTKADQAFTPGFVQIGSIYASTNLRGISMNGADFQDIDVTGSIGLGTKGPHALHGGIAVDIGNSQFRSGLLDDPFQAVGFGNIDVSGGVDSLILRGRTDNPSTNNLVGSITIGGKVNSFDTRFSDVLAPITAQSIGSAFFDDVLSNITTSGAITTFDANNILADVNVGTTVGGLSLSGSLLGTVTAESFGSISVDGNFTGLLLATTGGIGNVYINAGTAFTGTIQANAGNIAGIDVTQASTPFSAHIVALDGNIGNLTAGFFSGAAVTASGSIGNIVSNATSASVTSGIVNSVFSAGAGGIGSISSVASITDTHFESVGGAIGSVTVLQGGIEGVVLGGSTTTLATSIGNIQADMSIEDTSAIASGAIGTITSVAGHIGGSATSASWNAANNPKSDVFIGGSIGGLYALGDISGNVVTATAGNIGNITSHEGRIAFDSFRATGSIGNVYANSQDATFAFDSSGNVLGQTDGSATYGTPIPSASAIDHSYFYAGTGTIGTVTAHATAAGGYFSTGHIVVPGSAGGTGVGGSGGTASKGGTANGGNGYGGAGTGGLYKAEYFIHNSAIDYSTFTAGSGIGAITATDSSTFNCDYYGQFLHGGSIHADYNAAIRASTFTVTDTGLTGLVLGPITASAVGGNAITDSTFHAVSGNIGGVSGVTTSVDAIYKSVIEVDNGQVGVVKGVVRGGAGVGHGGDGLEGVIVNAGNGPNGVGPGTGYVAGIYGKSPYNGIDNTQVTAGPGGIGYITGISTGYNHANPYAHDGIVRSQFTTTGNITSVTGESVGGSGISLSKFTANYFETITGITSGYGSGISKSGFYAMHGIRNITGSSTSHFGGNGISDSLFNANTVMDGDGAIGIITGSTAGSHGADGSARADGIYNSSFFAGDGISSITGTATNVYGGSGIANSTFAVDVTHSGDGGIGSITGKTVGNRAAAGSGSGYGIYESHFYSGSGMGAIYGGALGAYSASGIAFSTFNADDAHKFDSTISSITGISDATSGSNAVAGVASGILDSTFTAGFEIGSIFGSTTAPGGGSAGIYGSGFFAGAGASSSSDGEGRIGTITGEIVSNGVYGVGHNFNFSGIAHSTFVAGGGPGSYGYIGDITGSAKINGAFQMRAYGIESSVFVAGSEAGRIEGVSGYAHAEGSQVEHENVSAIGINRSGFYAGTGVGGGFSYIGEIEVTGLAYAAFGSAYAAGIAHSTFDVGGSGTGVFEFVGVSATATAHGNATALGITESHFQASVLSGGRGYVEGISVNVNATSQQYAVAEGITNSGFWAGYAYGGFNEISVGATAHGETGSRAIGINGISHKGFSSYASTIPGGYTFQAGTAHDYGSGRFSEIFASGEAYANTGNATGIGINGAVIHSGYKTGGITEIQSTGDATSNAGNVYAAGIAHTKVTAGLGYGGSGNIGYLRAAGYAETESGSATAYGFTSSTVSSGLASGTIGNIRGIAEAYVLGSNVAKASALAIGIYKTNFYAGYSGTFGSIGNVYGEAIAKVHDSFQNSKDTSSATAIGFKKDIIDAQANNINYAAGGGTGTIGEIKGYGFAYAYGYQVKAAGYGIISTKAVASNGGSSNGSINGIYGHGTALAHAYTADATALAYGLGASAKGAGDYFAAGTGLDSTGHINNQVYGKAAATATGSGNGSAVSSSIAQGIDASNIFAGTGAYGDGYLPIIFGNATGTTRSGISTTTTYGINNTNIEAGRSIGVIGDINGTAAGTAEGYYGNATATSKGIHGTYIAAGLGQNSSGAIGSVTGSAFAGAYSFGINGKATSLAYGIDPSTISAGSAVYKATQIVFVGSKNAVGGTGTVASITGTATAKSVADGINGTATASAYGIDGLKVQLGYAYTNAGAAYGGTGTITNGITGNAYAYAKEPASGGVAIAHGTGIDALTVHLADAVGVGKAKGGTGTMGAVNSKVEVTALGTNESYAYGIGLEGVLLSASNATAGTAANDFAFGGTGTIGSLYQYMKVTATSTGQYAHSKAYSVPDLGLSLQAANATGWAAYGGHGYIAKNGTIKGVGKAYATGYYTAAEAGGLDGIIAGAGNATGGYYATGGYGNIGRFIGYATAKATSTKTAGSVTAKADAYGILLTAAGAGNATTANTNATARTYGGTGILGGFYGTAAATAKATSPFNGGGLAIATGIAGVLGDAGNAYNFGTGPAKSVEGKIGTQGLIKGVATAYSKVLGGGAATSYAIAGGILGIDLNAANAKTYGGGNAVAKNAYAYVNGVNGYGTATAYAYGKTDPKATAYGGGVTAFLVNAGSAFADTTGTGIAYAAGWHGTAPDAGANVRGFKGVGKAYGTAKGTAPVNSLTLAGGLAYGLVNSAIAYSLGGVAYGGEGLLGTSLGIYGKATTTSTATATVTSPNNPPAGSATAKGRAYGVTDTELYAGTGYSHDRVANAFGNRGEVGTTTGLAYATVSATGSPATTTGDAFGILNLGITAGSAYGLNAYAGYGNVGAVLAKGYVTGTSTPTSGGTTTATHNGYGIKHLTIYSATAYAVNLAEGGFGIVGNITGDGSSIATGTGGSGAVTATSAGIKDTYVYAGDAVATAMAGVADAGSGNIGAISGTGYAKATGTTATATSWGIDPSKFYAGAAITYGTEGTSRGGNGSHVGSVTGAAVSKAYASGTAISSAKGIYQTTVRAGDAFGGNNGGTIENAYRAYGGTGYIAQGGTIKGTAQAVATGYTATTTAAGIMNSYFSAGTALGSLVSGETESARGILGNIYAKAYGTATGNEGASGGYATARYGDGLLSDTFKAGYANGFDAFAGDAGTSTIGTTIAKGYSKASAYSVSVGGRSDGIQFVIMDAGYATGPGDIIAGAGTVAAGGTIYGKGISLGYSPDGFDGKITNDAGVGINGLVIRAGVAYSTAASLNDAFGAYGKVGNITGIGLTKSSATDAGTVKSMEGAGIAFSTNVQAGNATAYNEAEAGQGIIGNIYGKANSTAEGTVFNYVLSAGVIAGGHETVGIGSSVFEAGYAKTTNTNFDAYARGGNGSSIGTFTGRAYSYATSASATTAKAYAYGFYSVTGIAGSATAPNARAGSGSIGAISATAIAEATGYNATAVAEGIDPSTFSAGVANGSNFTGNGTQAVSGLGSVGNISASATATATGNNNPYTPNATASATAYGINGMKVLVGNAYGYEADARHGSTGNDTVGTISGYGNAYATAFAAKSAAKGIFNVNVDAGNAVGPSGLKVYGGTAQVANAGGSMVGIYGKGIAKAVATGVAVNTTANEKTETHSYGIESLFLFAGNGGSGSNKGDAGYSATAVIGNVYGLGRSTSTTAKGIDEVAYASGVSGITLNAAQAGGYVAHAGGTDSIGFVYGKGFAFADLGATAPTQVAKADAYGVKGMTLSAGDASAPNSTVNNIATAGAATIGNLSGHAYAYSIAGAVAGVASSTAIGLSNANVTAGIAIGDVPTGAAATIGTIVGIGKGEATGFSATTTVKGIDPSKFYAGTTSYGVSNTVAGSYAGSPNIVPTAQAGIGSIGAITGTAYGFANGEGDGGTSHVYGILSLSAYAGVPFGGGTVAKGTIGAVTGTAKSYAFGTGGSYNATGYGMDTVTLNAGFGTGQVGTSSIGQIDGYGTSSNATPLSTPSGSSNSSRGIEHLLAYTGGSIAGITGKAMQGSKAQAFPPVSAATIYGAHLKAGTSIGIIKATNTGTGVVNQGIANSTFDAGTSIAGVYAKVAAGTANAIWASGFRAGIAPGATAGIGYVKAYVPVADDAGAGIGNSAFTTNGNIGNITLTGTVFTDTIAQGFHTGFFAGDMLGAGYTVTGYSYTANAQIGTVNITGYFAGADLVASVKTTHTYFGNTSDSGTSGTIGNVTVTLPNPLTTGGSATSAVEAGNLGTVAWGNNANVTTSGNGTVISSIGGGAYDVRVRKI
ncbi:MAG: hypothetical protein ABSE62_02550 [Chthoniobacteraceae bacterium]|jgi:hypothetical protein